MHVKYLYITHVPNHSKPNYTKPNHTKLSQKPAGPLSNVTCYYYFCSVVYWWFLQPQDVEYHQSSANVLIELIILNLLDIKYISRQTHVFSIRMQYWYPQFEIILIGLFKIETWGFRQDIKDVKGIGLMMMTTINPINLINPINSINPINPINSINPINPN